MLSSTSDAFDSFSSVLTSSPPSTGRVQPPAISNGKFVRELIKPEINVPLYRIANPSASTFSAHHDPSVRPRPFGSLLPLSDRRYSQSPRSFSSTRTAATTVLRRCRITSRSGRRAAGGGRGRSPTSSRGMVVELTVDFHRQDWIDRCYQCRRRLGRCRRGYQQL